MQTFCGQGVRRSIFRDFVWTSYMIRSQSEVTNDFMIIYFHSGDFVAIIAKLIRLL